MFNYYLLLLLLMFFVVLSGTTENRQLYDPNDETKYSGKYADDYELLFPEMQYEGYDYEIGPKDIKEIPESLQNEFFEYMDHALSFDDEGENENFTSNEDDDDGEGILPSYCDPPNPCPPGFSTENGCLVSFEFEDTAGFSREYQRRQNCMCDTEHTFDCPKKAKKPEEMAAEYRMARHLRDVPKSVLVPVAAKKGFLMDE